ncbi:MAG: putative phosphoribosyl transferase [Chlamydiae bacterium]|nr:putative phosphoribosyl transferase [Chlamydiota bacterium]
MKIPLKDVTLEGDLVVPKGAIGIVIFAHGSGSSRHSPRNKMVAEEIAKVGHATLLFDLLTEEEDQNPEKRFDIPFLADRLMRVAHFIEKNPETKGMKIGFFGASTGAAAALETAAEMKQGISAVVSRGGRPDLAGASLTQVTAPTLLIVGGNDTQVITLNEQAFAELGCEKKMEIIEGASHLFEEPGCLMQIAHLAEKWFTKYL